MKEGNKEEMKGEVKEAKGMEGNKGKTRERKGKEGKGRKRKEGRK